MSIARDPELASVRFEPFDALTPEHLATVTELHPEQLSPDEVKLSDIMAAISSGVEQATTSQGNAASRFEAHTAGLARNTLALEQRRARLSEIVELRRTLEVSIADGERLVRGGSRTVQGYESRVAELNQKRADALREKVAKDLALEAEAAKARGDDPEISYEQKMEATYIIHGLDPRDGTPDHNSLRAQAGKLQRDITAIDQELLDLNEDQIPKLKETIQLCLTRLHHDRATYKQLDVEFARLDKECRSFLARVALDQAYFDSINVRDSAIVWTSRATASPPEDD